nr:hypothetical protein Q903MT_gene2167 [Picea sitchensis]
MRPPLAARPAFEHPAGREECGLELTLSTLSTLCLPSIAQGHHVQPSSGKVVPILFIR